jgi:hypothetical protein
MQARLPESIAAIFGHLADILRHQHEVRGVCSCHRGRSQSDGTADAEARNEAGGVKERHQSTAEQRGDDRDSWATARSARNAGSGRSRRPHPRAWIRQRARTRDRSPLNPRASTSAVSQSPSRDLPSAPAAREVPPGTDAGPKIRARPRSSPTAARRPPRCPFPKAAGSLSAMRFREPFVANAIARRRRRDNKSDRADCGAPGTGER